MRFMCNKCGNTAIYLVKKGYAQVGAYCMDCGAWVKWVGKKDLNNLQRQGYHVQPEGYVSPTVKIKQEQLAKDRELLEKVNKDVLNKLYTSNIYHNSVERVELNATCSNCGELDEDTVIVKLRDGNLKGLYCKHCGKWIKWLGEKQYKYLLACGVEPKENDYVIPTDNSDIKDNQSKVSNDIDDTFDISCKKCGYMDVDDVYIFAKGKTHVGLYCKNCKTWIKWLGKKELEKLRRLGVTENQEQVKVVDKSLDLTKNKEFLAIANNLECEEDEYDYEEDSDVWGEEDEMGFDDGSRGSYSNANKKEKEVECNFCNGNSELKPITDSKVELTYFGGVLSIVDVSGTELLGSYKLSVCPSCGRKL